MRGWVLTTLFDPSETLGLIEKEPATCLYGFDTHWSELAILQTSENRGLSSLRPGMLASNMATSEAVARRAQKLIRLIITTWGMTECGIPLNFFLYSSENERCASFGSPLPVYEFEMINS